jgi:AraC family transcriptional regulator, regulatory protein of adaptative response / methylated-DNA-[protein]-cysteine methyltransferase
MSIEENINYLRIKDAIAYIQQNFRRQPSLDEIASAVHLSPFHFQRIFTEWAGTSPKKFLQYISTGYARKMLKEEQASLFDTAYATGLSGTGRLHDLFISLEGMTPAEYKNGGRNLNIQYNFYESPFGKMIVASTAKGICHMAFADDESSAIKPLKTEFPNALCQERSDAMQQLAVTVFVQDWNQTDIIKLYLKGTPFQLRVWETLLKIPKGRLTTYGTIARLTGNPRASRAIGTAVGDNPVACLIPCHRVIQSSGILGGYRWGQERKAAIIGWEAAKTDTAFTGHQG